MMIVVENIYSRYIYPLVARSVERTTGLIVVVLEGLIALLLSLAVVLSVAKLSGEVVQLAAGTVFDRQLFVRFLDEALLMIVAVDLVRTLLMSVTEKRIPVLVVLEAALIFIVREIITMELREVSDVRMVLYIVTFAAFFAAWMLARRQQGAEN